MTPNTYCASLIRSHRHSWLTRFVLRGLIACALFGWIALEVTERLMR